MQYCNDCFAKFDDSVKRCKKCKSVDIRKFQASVVIERAGGQPGSIDTSSLKSSRLDPIFTKQPRDLRESGLPEVMYFASSEAELRRNEARVKKNAAKSLKAARKRQKRWKLPRLLSSRRGKFTGGITGLALLGTAFYYLFVGATWLPAAGLAPKSFNAWGIVNEGIAALQKSPERIFPAVDVDPNDSYKLLEYDTDYPLPTWDPCRPVHWVVNPENEPPGARRELVSAFSSVSAATGLSFEFAGETVEPFDAQRANKSTLYDDIGLDWNPVLITYLQPNDWENANRETFRSSGVEVAGFAGPGTEYSIGVEQRPVFVSGAITFSSKVFGNLMQSGYGQNARAIMMHEIGHLVGLDHINDDRELMFSDNVGSTDWGPGDRFGLSRMGAGTCMKDAVYPKSNSLGF